jgi:hypothetical protein
MGKKCGFGQFSGESMDDSPIQGIYPWRRKQQKLWDIRDTM